MLMPWTPWRPQGWNTDSLGSFKTAGLEPHRCSPFSGVALFSEATMLCIWLPPAPFLFHPSAGPELVASLGLPASFYLSFIHIQLTLPCPDSPWIKVHLEYKSGLSPGLTCGRQVLGTREALLQWVDPQVPASHLSVHLVYKLDKMPVTKHG